MRKENGITLIALVITIVVLVTLGGVSVYLILGQNGIITRAQQAKEDTLIAQNEEQAQLAKADEYIEGSREQVTIDKEEYEQMKKDIQELKNRKSTLLWEGYTKTTGTTYNFTDANCDVDNYDYILIEYTQNDIYIHSTMIRKESITKDKRNDIALWGYNIRYMILHFTDNGFVIDTNNTDSSSYIIYISRIIGINI